MSNIVTAYQTLEDRDNPDEVEMDGPYPCTHKGAWLGIGHYFWDTNIGWAHSWGEIAYVKFSKEYLIARCQIDLSIDCFDLVGCVQHWADLMETLKVMTSSNKIIDDKEAIVPNLIMFMKRNNIFNYKSIRAADMHKQAVNLYFKKNGGEFMVINQRVQICVIDKKDVILRPFSVIYPDKYLI